MVKRREMLVEAPAAMTEKEYLARVAAERATTLDSVGLNLDAISSVFTAAIDKVATEITTAMAVQGFWQGEAGLTGVKIALMHSELSEALEADRKGIEADDKIPDFTGLEAELADTVIRILDYAGQHQLRLGAAIIAKMQVNLTREFKHGKGY